ncbi:hypothetical protein [Rhizobium sp.]
MAESCPVLTPEERQQVDIIARAEGRLMAAVAKALDDAHAEATNEMAALGFAETTPARDYFAAVAHQKLFLLLCGADAETMKGGDPAIAASLIDNARNIAEHYWGNDNKDER